MADDRDEISSLDFPCGAFPAHGEFRVRFQDGLFRWTNRGPFNAEALQQFDQARKAAFARWCRMQEPVAAVVEWRESALMSQDAFDLYRQGLERFLASPHQLRAVAWVAPQELEGMRFMRQRFIDLFEHHQLPLQLFESLAEALTWVAAMQRGKHSPSASSGQAGRTNA
ncbi:MAG: hypothetical protein J0L58_11140 [Burkholderiales bacterium]|nr:hypothetical protein [Burkholderiales bacterium]